MTRDSGPKFGYAMKTSQKIGDVAAFVVAMNTLGRIVAGEAAHERWGKRPEGDLDTIDLISIVIIHGKWQTNNAMGQRSYPESGSITAPHTHDCCGRRRL